MAQGQGTWLLHEDKEAPAGGGIQGPPHPRAEARKPPSCFGMLPKVWGRFSPAV